MIVKFSEEGLIPEKLNVNCHKDMLIYSFIFQKKGVYYAVKDKKIFFDEVQGECEYNFNSYSSEVEINFKKLNMFKVWERLFKKN
eukprot:CAMPEP_0170530392 /NCGR_PEP_ID=MMETSP0209-20121228/46762_1 /TAXON_ID=665100 ORGANISM="Litonotus pictus, Strain P1" /NCGR_SAMPLE_ID=MMETSP0209 /ASSEMBLY_ACC=CAM_ASM_000301 /LENGTH=84 /DNA_ID=CAMNT_0010823467 /DNA_START=476 /DNA_END=730 /DNA_ORIENTATION=-